MSNLTAAVIGFALAVIGACLCGYQLFEYGRGIRASGLRLLLISLLVIGGFVLYAQNVKWAIHQQMRVYEFRDYPLRKDHLE